MRVHRMILVKMEAKLWEHKNKTLPNYLLSVYRNSAFVFVYSWENTLRFVNITVQQMCFRQVIMYICLNLKSTTV